MACTTILVGKKASNDGSTMIARNDDGHFTVKKMTVVTPDKQPKVYNSVNGHVKIELPDNPLRYTCTPNVSKADGIWPANGINSENVAMTATETITTNPRVLAADPLVVYRKAVKKGEKDIPGGIGEEEMVMIVLPYIHSAREGVERLGTLLEKYGTYEMNGIAFSDKDEIWWLETIGGHHWIARRVADEEVVIMPNQFGLDQFDMDDALGAKKDNMCSADLREFVEENHLYVGNPDEPFNPRLAFGSHSDADHVYNTPRAWYMARYFLPTSYVWDGEMADFTPESDYLPWSFIPEKKVTLEDIKYILSSYYQGTDYNPMAKADAPKKGLYRPIGISRTDVMAILQIRGYMPKEIAALEWVCFASNPYNQVMPVYANVDRVPVYLSNVTLDIDTDCFYWQSRLAGALADPYFGPCVQHIERYQNAVMAKGRRLVYEYDKKMLESGKFNLMDEANKQICVAVKKETDAYLKNLLSTVSEFMHCGFSRADN